MFISDRSTPRWSSFGVGAAHSVERSNVLYLLYYNGGVLGNGKDIQIMSRSNSKTPNPSQSTFRTRNLNQCRTALRTTLYIRLLRQLLNFRFPKPIPAPASMSSAALETAKSSLGGCFDLGLHGEGSGDAIPEVANEKRLESEDHWKGAKKVARLGRGTSMEARCSYNCSSRKDRARPSG
jgi:hypothetical protein